MEGKEGSEKVEGKDKDWGAWHDVGVAVEEVIHINSWRWSEGWSVVRRSYGISSYLPICVPAHHPEIGPEVAVPAQLERIGLGARAKESSWIEVDGERKHE